MYDSAGTMSIDVRSKNMSRVLYNREGSKIACLSIILNVQATLIKLCEMTLIKETRHLVKIQWISYCLIGVFLRLCVLYLGSWIFHNQDIKRKPSPTMKYLRSFSTNFTNDLCFSVWKLECPNMISFLNWVTCSPSCFGTPCWHFQSVSKLGNLIEKGLFSPKCFTGSVVKTRYPQGENHLF